ncbi:sulfotransferase 6B1-like [Sceloporus undulatus]|uniref:sulfotransferase 6B1-like n=1 Tax=Sceloporus undulatus TaxID=8520 RepID=UPI001C4BAAD8|nr:sulfotransferase 6B1-like [Sceloporus undulatus]
MSYFNKKFMELSEKAAKDAEKIPREQKLFTYDGVTYPTTLCSSEVFKALESFEARSDDIILAGYCKSGSFWIGQIVTDLVITSAKKHEPHKLNEELMMAEFPYLEIGDPEKYQRMKSHRSRRVLFTHLRADKLPKSVFKNKAKILLLVRNPKDVAASFFHFTKTYAAYPSHDTFGTFFEAFIKGEMPFGSYIDYHCVWNKYIDEENVMPITYEEMIENTALGVEKMAKFFELNLSEEDIQGVAERSTYKAMKDNAKKTYGEFGDSVFHEGGVSDWKTLFTQENNQEMDMVFKECLAGTKVGEMIKYDVYCKA